tara:strand:- start:499 stop:879 length:381 start_codon:yes stop_codon:yes gene_type:complete
VASLELHGTVLIWLLIETQDHEAAATDYGQAVGGRVRLFRSGHVPLSAGQYDANATGEEKRKELLPLRTLCIGFSPAEVRHSKYSHSKYSLTFSPAEASRFLAGHLPPTTYHRLLLTADRLPPTTH